MVAVLRRCLAPCCIAVLYWTACGSPAHQQQARDDLQIPDDGLEADAASSSDNTGATECYVPEARPIPTRNDCAPTAAACEPSSDTCLFTPLALTLRNLIFDSCDVNCGELEIGASQGCITVVENGNVSDFECVREHLLGTRWECAPSDGMARVFLDSCTIR